MPQFFNAAAFRIDHKDKSVTYSGDSCYDNRLINLATNSDLALFEASVAPSAYRSSGPRPNHLSPYECGRIAKLAKVKTLALVHLYDNSSSTEIIEEVRRNFEGRLILTHDMEKIAVE